MPKGIIIIGHLCIVLGVNGFKESCFWPNYEVFMSYKGKEGFCGGKLFKIQMSLG